MIKMFVFLMSFGCAVVSAAPQRPENREAVILIHGLGRTSHSMQTMARALKAAGFSTVNLDYPSRKFTIETLAMRHIPQGVQRCRDMGATTIHFVTHSMGGILLRYYLTQRTLTGLGRVVMLSPPNQGSEAADALKNNAFYRWYCGPAGQQLGTDPSSLVLGLSPVDYPVGVITGSQHAFFDSWLSARIPGKDDGKVAVESAKVQGMTDFLVLPYAHPFIMNQREVIKQAIYFLEHGRFNSPQATVQTESFRSQLSD